MLESIFNYWQLEQEISFSPNSLNYLFSSQSAEIFLGKEKIGFFGQIHPQVFPSYQTGEKIFIAQISLTKISDYLSKFPSKIFYKPVSNFPSSEKDLSFLFSENTDYSQVIKEIRKITGDNLQEITVFDVYQNAEMAKVGERSMSFHLIFQSFTKTLESKEIEEIMKNIIERVENLFSAKLRG